MRADSGPLRGGDGVHAGIADGAVFRDRMRAQNAVEFCAEALNGAAALLIEEVSAELDGEAAEGVECELSFLFVVSHSGCHSYSSVTE